MEELVIRFGVINLHNGRVSYKGVINLHNGRVINLHNGRVTYKVWSN